MPSPATAPQDGGTLFPDDSGDRKSGHAAAHVCLHHPPHTVPHQPTPTLPQGPADPPFRTEGQPAAHLVARAAASYVAAVEPNTPLMTETGESPHTVADHPADAIHLPLPSGLLTPCPRRYRDAALGISLHLPPCPTVRSRPTAVGWPACQYSGTAAAVLAAGPPPRGASDATDPPGNPLPHTPAPCGLPPGVAWLSGHDAATWPLGMHLAQRDAPAPHGPGRILGDLTGRHIE
jgi:hypothetical protein